MKFISDIQFLLDAFGKYKKQAVVLFFVIIAAAVTETLGLWVILPLLDIIINSQASTDVPSFFVTFLNFFPHSHHLLVVCAVAISLVAAKSIFFLLRTYWSIKFISNMRKYWSAGVMRTYMYSKFPSLIRQKKGVLLNNVINEPVLASKALRDITDFLAKAIISLAIIIVLLAVNWKITVVVTLFSIVIVMMVRRVTHEYSYAVGKKKIKLNQEISSVAAESLSGIRQIKTFSMEKMVIRDFFNRIASLLSVIVKFSVVGGLPRAFAELVIIITALGGLVFYKYFVNTSVASILPLMGFFIISAQRLFGNVSELLAQRMSIISYMPSLKLVEGIVKDLSVLEDMVGGDELHVVQDGIRFKNVCFSHEDSKLLFDNLNLEIEKGSIIAAAGPSGSGKSTLCDLLIGFYRPVSGEILIDGKDLRKYNIKSWRNNIGYISQDTFLFNLSVKENIIIGQPEASEEEVCEAARQAGASEFIESLPERYDTIIGDRGVALSGGQRQRLAIARALIREVEVLIFDEATSSLDSEAERDILDFLKSLRGRKTILIITHRLSSLDVADKIYVLDKGSIVESGRYNELLRKKGLFWRLEQITRKEDFESVEISEAVQS
jgi:ABC-type multidrug transport system fused ATPase/permease subunit